MKQDLRFYLAVVVATLALSLVCTGAGRAADDKSSGAIDWNYARQLHRSRAPERSSRPRSRPTWSGLKRPVRRTRREGRPLQARATTPGLTRSTRNVCGAKRLPRKSGISSKAAGMRWKAESKDRTRRIRPSEPPTGPRRSPARESTGLVPLTDLGKQAYQGEQGGLYPGGENTPPAAKPSGGAAAGGSNRAPGSPGATVSRWPHCLVHDRHVEHHPGNTVVFEAGVCRARDESETHAGRLRAEVRRRRAGFLTPNVPTGSSSSSAWPTPR